MTLKISSVLQAVGACATVAASVGAFALPGMRVALPLDRSNSSLTEAGSTVVPDIQHQWQRAAEVVAGMDPNIIHRWPTTTATFAVADLDPEIYHHWS